MTSIEPALTDLAASQSGAFCSAQAHLLGVDDLELYRLVREGVLLRVRRGAFVCADAVSGLTPEQLYAVQSRAVLLSRGDPGWVSHYAALALAGLPLVHLDLSRFDLCAEVRREFRNGNVVTHPLPAGEPTVLVGGVRSISTESAVVLTAVRHGLKPGVVAADAAMHHGLLDVSGLSRATTRLALGVRGRAKASRLLQLVDASSESPGESLTRMLLVGLGARFTTQVDLRDQQGLIGRVDFLVEQRIVLEFDGLVKYDGVQGREALAAEKRREDRLRAAGYEVVRLTWADLQAPSRLALLLRQARSRAALRSA